MTRRISSRIPGFYRRPLADRRSLFVRRLSPKSRAVIMTGGGLSLSVADMMSENVIASHGLPLSLALNFVVNGRDFVIPMAVEEPSVVAAASNAARLVRRGGGFRGSASPPVMTAQIQLDGVPTPDHAAAIIANHRGQLLAIGNRSIPSMVARGGGCVDIDAKVVDRKTGLVVVRVFVHVGDAMGANVVDTVAEALAESVREQLGGTIGLRILSNLAVRRTVRVSARIPQDTIGGRGVAQAIVRASRFAELDPERAVTHNKGIMNGIDAAAVALGQDWRAIEAGAHAFAARDGQYRPLSTWRLGGSFLVGRLRLPMAVGTVGGATRVHPGVRAAFELLDVESAGELGVVLASAGLASNLAALRALADEGIQRGHMRLHQRRTAGATVKPRLSAGAVANDASGEPPPETGLQPGQSDAAGT